MSARMRLVGSALSLALLAACGDDAPAVSIPELHDVKDAPVKIRQAARAVVRIGTAELWGTGAFISSNGLLMTNNHVLGAEVCPLEGCWVNLSFLRQRGEALLPAKMVFAVPQHVDVGLDLAVLQTYNGDDLAVELETPDYLTFSGFSAPQLVGKHVTIVGHPGGYLKKWSDGVIIDAHGAWFDATNFILPGDSGSPVLDDEGKIVGLIHRSQSDDFQFTRSGVATESIGTASAPLIEALKAPLPAVMFSVDATVTRERAVAMSSLYFAARTATANVGGAATNVLSLLADACDLALASTDIASPDELDAALAPCYEAQTWIECRDRELASEPGTVCPSEIERAAWRDRYRALNERYRALDGSLDLYSVSFGIAALASDDDRGEQDAQQALSEVLSAAKPVLDFDVARFMAAFELRTDEIVHLIDHYRDVPHYQSSAFSLAIAVGWLGNHGNLTSTRTLDIYDELARDRDVPLRTRLYIEEVKYLWGKL